MTDDQITVLLNVDLSLPIPLAKADLTKPFIYDRRWGVFLCPGGHHQIGMATLLAFHHGCRDGIEVGAKLKLGPFSSEAADYYLQTVPGTAFKSSVGTSLVTTWSRHSLSTMERRRLGPLRFLSIP